MNNPAISLGSFAELFTTMVKEAVAEALREQKNQEPHRYPERVSVSLASEITGYSINSLYQMHSKGRIPGASKVGGKLMFNTAVLRKWIEDGGNTK